MSGSRVAVAVLALGTVTLTACQAADPGPVVAAASLTLDRNTVPAGGPLVMRYAFDVLGEGPGANDLRVFVHFLAPDGTVLWTDDHMPMPPSSAWQPGTRVEYERVYFVPRREYQGPVIVAAGLVDPASGERARLENPSDGLREYRLAEVDVRSPADALPLGLADGWHELERATGGSDREWRWSMGRAQLRMAAPSGEVRLYLDLDQPVELPAPQRVEVWVGDRLLDTFDAEPGVRWLRQIRLSEGDFGAADEGVVELRVTPPFVPARLASDPDGDSRELGVRLFAAFLEPVG